ncbi:MAG: HAD family hydrolase [Clostridia bacterium]|nr:HAD family hydrolase [Clostridia bacterium]
MYKLIIFDLDGTLLDTSRTIQSVLNNSLKKFSLPVISLENTVRFVGNGARKLVERAVGEEKRELWEAVYSDYSEHFSNCSNEHTSLYEGAEEALYKLNKNGIRLAIVTNKPKRATMRAYEEFLSKYGFCAVVGQSSDTPLKPNPQSVLKIISDLGVKKEECLFVGDGETDVTTAVNAGIDCVSVLWGYRKKDELASAGATRFVNTFPELVTVALSG